MIGARKYAQTQNETASKERLMVLLFETALKHMRTGAVALETGKRTEANKVLGKASDIVLELHRTLDPNQAPQLCEQLGEIYRFTAQRLTQAIASGDPKAVREAERAFLPLVEAFQQAVAQLGQPPVKGVPR